MYYHRILPVWTSLPSVESDCGSFKCLRDHWVTAAASQSDSEVKVMNLNPANPGSTPTDTCVQESLVVAGRTFGQNAPVCQSLIPV